MDATRMAPPRPPTGSAPVDATVSGLLLLTAGALTAVAGFRPWVTLSLPALGATVRAPDFRYAPAAASGISSLQPLILALAAGLIILGALMLLTRARWAVWVCRGCALLVTVAAAVTLGFLWTAIVGGPDSVVDLDTGLTATKAVALSKALSSVGSSDLATVKVAPGIGLYLLSAAAVVALAGVIAPGSRPRPATGDSPGPGGA